MLRLRWVKQQIISSEQGATSGELHATRSELIGSELIGHQTGHSLFHISFRKQVV
jgi:hypothetical protein